MAFVDEVSTPTGGGVSGLLSGVAGIAGMANPLVAGLGAVGGLSSMFGGGASSDIARAGGTFYTGEMSYSNSAKPFDASTLIIVAAVVLGLLLIFKGKK